MKTTDIRFIKRFEKDGVTYCWYIANKSYNISDGREFINYENGKTVVKEYKKEDLPKYAQRYIATHNESVLQDFENGFIHYIIK